ncbi:MAG TPA: protein kinase [Blastocatellia bacterium]|nr:protein kinase [Blastocatellia bacterium]
MKSDLTLGRKAPANSMVGTTVGNYLITGELAQGGMGAVYRGRHQALPREVVVKSILLSSFPPQAQEQLKARFVREAYVQSQLDHPNIVRVYEFFTAPENYYLVMEFVNGMSLRDLVHRQGALAPNQAVALFKQALSALDYAHNFSYVDEAGRPLKGIIHRDIKPANLLLDGLGRLKITDFGIVKLAGERSMTRTGFNPGTIEYMSPEQIRGQEVDARSDLYSLGVSFYEALSGRLPFPYSESGSEYEVMKGHTELSPPPLSLLAPHVPAALADVVMRSLAKDPNNRFASAAEFLDALLEYERPNASSNQSSVAAPANQLTHSMTEVLESPTQPAPLTTEVLPAGSTHPNAKRQPARPAPARPVEFDQLQTNITPKQMPPKPQRSGSSGVIAVGVVLLCLLAGGGYFFWSRNSAVVEPSTTSAPPTTISTPAAPQEDERLKQMRDLEQQERYADAIRVYSEYLQANGQAADAAQISARLADLKKLQGLLTVADLELSKQDYAAAKRDYSEALKLRPNSKRAQSGLAEAEAKLR